MKKIESYWYILVGFISIAVMWGEFTTKTDANSSEIFNIEKQQLVYQQDVTDVKITSATILERVNNMSEDIKFIKSKLK